MLGRARDACARVASTLHDGFLDYESRCMGPRLPRVTATELVRALQHAGWYRDHQTGSHIFLRHPVKLGTVNVPFHAGRIIKPASLQRILETAGLTVDELRELL